MARLIAFRRFRTDRRQNDPTSPVDVSPYPLAASTRDLPQFTELAEVVLNRTEQTFGRRTDGALLERFALEAVIDALSKPALALDAVHPADSPHGHRALEESNAA